MSACSFSSQLINFYYVNNILGFRDTLTMDYDGARIDEATTDKATNVELEMTRLGTVEVVSDETMNLGS